MKAHWKIILSILGVTLPSLFTYLAARVESNEAKVRAEVAYVTMQDVVKDLQEASYKQALQLAKIEGQLEAQGRLFEKSAALPSGLHPLLPIPSPVVIADRDGIHDAPAPVKLTSPPDFSDAVQSYKAKK